MGELYLNPGPPAGGIEISQQRVILHTLAIPSAAYPPGVGEDVARKPSWFT